MNSSIFKNKNLFKKPTAKPPSDDSGLFSRSKETFETRTAEHAAKKAEEAARRRKEEDLKRQEEETAAAAQIGDVEYTTLTSSPSRNRGGGERRSKRARLSQNEDETLTQESRGHEKARKTPTQTSPSSTHKSKSPGDLTETPSSPRALSERYENAVSQRTRRNNSAKTVVVDLESDDEESQGPAPGNEDEVESDPYLAELTRRAKEKARRQRLQEDTPVIPTPGTPSGLFQAPSSSPEKAKEQPVVKYLITSNHPGTSQLVTHRRFDQRTREVRLEWCRRQGFSKEATKDWVLTFKSRQVYDSSTCRGLGFTVHNGVVVRETDLYTPFDKIHLEAMTYDELDKMEKARVRKAQGLEEDDTPQAPPAAEEPKEEVIRLVLRSKAFEDFKVKCRPSNKITRILKAFRTSNEIPEDKDVFISLDGDRLDTDSLIGDHDFEDMDVVDVNIS